MVSSPKWKTLAASTASAPASTAGAKCSAVPGAAAGDDRDADRGPHRPDQLEVEALPGAVGVHRVEQDLAGPELGRPGAPRDGLQSRRPATAVRRHLEVAGVLPGPTHVGRQDEHLGAEPVGDLGDHLRAGDGSGVDAHLVGARTQQPVDVVDRPHAAAHRERDEDLLGRPADDVVHGRPRSPLLAVTSRKVSSSAPCSS